MLAIDSTNSVFLDGLTNTETRAYEDGATVALRVLDSDDVEVVASVSMPNESNGDYRGNFFADSADFTEGDTYTVEVTVDGPDGKLEIRFPEVANYAGACAGCC